ncbi:long-chain-fatty-acid--CoA ligase ACSBG2 isoform X1 [Gorilla gorilla gorilla]|uniref:long-chain-fatty-acid--CoA ligase ACSBG2 isoform X1 n=3 Tax=Gorilla gorilla gorilla TaxID=9595 RepID=UPI002446324B|nr:long-chain-fatty-acid--CoA ligase ACSBG2 isoform X1 [Gorilla gorilla gorilla]XP_055227385.1 long-chain-fatty-acid--CoA ligase ACSBG2 isoform X1 [Gorilla gorilla gorilla]XP_055227386.1 long-chain-fatty-acid--CoA ligase ACSBG2 isoform X1 [Gorilla gorilla gorilla]XP_055227387.1 long-chain-fatty-acid--CoA ligase ACSBG2 isoform X1 [Gorilla gorilla gorilla]
MTGTPKTQEGAKDREVDMNKTEVTPRLWTTCRDGEVLLRLSKHGPGHETPMTIPEFFRESVNRFGTYPALASKNGKKWEILNFNQYYEACRKAAKSLIKLGLERFHGVGILGFNSAEWFITAVGAILAGGLCVGIYATNSAEACQYVITHAKVNILLVENDQQLQKILSIPQSSLEPLKAIIQYRLPMKKNNNLYSWDDFMELGRSIPDTQLEQVIESHKANQCAVLIYTSGTTGIPKGVMLSHDNITWMAGAVTKDFKLTEKHEMVVSYLPLSHIAAQMMDIWVPIKTGALTYFAQADALKGTLVSTLKEVKPTVFIGVPQIWEKIHETVKKNSAKSTGLKKKAFVWARNIGFKVNSKKMLGKYNTPVSYRMAKTLVFSKVKTSLGLDHCHSFISGTAPLNQETAEFFLSLDIPIGELYGLSESSGPHTISNQNNYRLLSCGKILTGCKNMLFQQNKNGTGEICLWGRHIFMGYLESETETTEAIDDEGWLHSGDLGQLDGLGFLYVTGCIKEILITAGGENVPPIPVETLVKKKIPIISNAMLVGDKLKFLSMLLTLKCEMNQMSGEPLDKLNFEAINFCRGLGSQASTVTEIVKQQDPLVYKAIQQGINAVNQEAMNSAQKIQKWVILEKDFSIYGGELGPMMKLKRHFVAQKYKKQIDHMYH